jgi:hypothetical protein
MDRLALEGELPLLNLQLHIDAGNTNSHTILNEGRLYGVNPVVLVQPDAGFGQQIANGEGVRTQHAFLTVGN